MNATVFAQQSNGLPAVKTRILNTKLLPAMEALNQRDSFNVIVELLASASEEEVKLIDEFLTSRKHPKASKIYADEAVRQIRTGVFQSNPSVVQMRIIESSLSEEIDQKIKSIDAEHEKIAAADLPLDWKGAEEFFWRFHVRQNELIGAQKLSSFAERIQAAISDGAKPANKTSGDLYVARIELMKNEARFRTKQIETSTAALATANDFRSQFLAMLQLNSAKAFFDDFFKNHSGGFANQQLAEAFKARIDEKIKLAETAHADITKKVVHFREGLHWWFRGRYGASDQAGGLLKPTIAMKDLQAMYELQLPKFRPKPSSNIVFADSTTGSPAYFERRHHYNWKIGHRERFSEGTAGETRPFSIPDIPGLAHPCGREPIYSGKLQYTSFTQKIFDDRSIVPRLVGSFEYWNSLLALEQLVRISNSEETAIYDEVIATRPEFSFHIGLAKSYGGDKIAFDAKKIAFAKSSQPSNALPSNAPNAPNNKPAGNQSLRSGLAWLIALARVELGASLSAYTNTENPFDKFGPTAFERQQYELIIFDDALFHLLTLTNDRDFQFVSKKTQTANLMTLDYWRRLKLTLDLLKSASQSQLNNLSSQDYLLDATKKLKRKAKYMYSNISLKAVDLDRKQELRSLLFQVRGARRTFDN